LDLETLLKLLAVVGSLGGALVAVLVAHRLRERAENRRRAEDEQQEIRRREEEKQQEIVGLLRLLDVELERNNDNVTRFLAQHRLYASEHWEAKWNRIGTSVATWEKTRRRLAQLLSAEDFKNLDDFYHNLQYVLDSAKRATDGVSRYDMDDSSEAIKAMNRLPTLGKEARQIVQRIIGENA
jgi:hypothetical protein